MRLLGRYFSALLFSPFLSIAVTLAFFHILGIFPSVNDFSNRICSGFLITDWVSFKKFGCILSGPCDLDEFSLSIALDTNSSVIVTLFKGWL